MDVGLSGAMTERHCTGQPEKTRLAQQNIATKTASRTNFSRLKIALSPRNTPLLATLNFQKTLFLNLC
jgi:hypothetical protein